MISQIKQIEYTVVSSDKEAILLEANLIHAKQPQYNIQLKDDRNYLYVRLTSDPIPGYFLTRRKYDPRSSYFGPYTKKFAIASVMRTLRIIFPYCQERTPLDQSSGPKFCSYYQIKQCDGICGGLEQLTDYNARLDQIQKVLSGKTEEAHNWIKSKILSAIELGNYPLAALWRDRLEMMKDTIGDQKVILPQPQDLELVTLVTQTQDDGLQIGSVFVQSIRAGKLININNFLLSGNSEVDNENEGVETDDATKEISTKTVANSFLQRFLISYTSGLEDKVPILVQSWDGDNQSAEFNNSN